MSVTPAQTDLVNLTIDLNLEDRARFGIQIKPNIGCQKPSRPVVARDFIAN